LQLPNDHKWSEYVRVAHDPFWIGVRSALISFVAIGPRFTPQHLGTGFVIGVNEDGFLLALTAKHVVEYGAIKVQRPQSSRAPSAPSILFEADKPEIGVDDLRAVWMGAQHADILFVRHVAYANDLDVALCLIEAQENIRKDIHKLVPSIALDTRIPQVGEWIHIVSLSGLGFDKVSNQEGPRGTWRVETRPVIRVGTVLSNEAESMGHKGPCFVTSIPVDGGMSGGFAYVPREGSLAACGIVSTGPKEDDGQVDFRILGHSTVVGVLGALALQVPVSTQPTYSLLLDLVKSGQVQDVAGGGQNLAIRNGARPGDIEVYQVG